MIRKTLLASLLTVISGTVFALPNVTILATGGTIAGVETLPLLQATQQEN